MEQDNSLLDAIEQSPLVRKQALSPGQRTKAHAKLVSNLYVYLNDLKKSRYQDSTVEVMTVTERCLKTYEPENGRFLPYFMKALNTELSRHDAIEYAAVTFGGMSIPKRRKRALSALRKLVDKYQWHVDTPEFRQLAEETLDITAAQVDDLLVQLHQAPTSIQKEQNKENLLPTPDLNLHDLLCCERQSEMMHQIEGVFLNCQARTKPRICAVFTLKNLPTLASFAVDLTPYTVVHQDMLNTYRQCPTAPMTLKSLAGELGVSESALSTTLHGFYAKLHQVLR